MLHRMKRDHRPYIYLRDSSRESFADITPQQFAEPIRWQLHGISNRSIGVMPHCRNTKRTRAQFAADLVHGMSEQQRRAFLGATILQVFGHRRYQASRMRGEVYPFTRNAHDSDERFLINSRFRVSQDAGDALSRTDDVPDHWAV